MCKKIFLSFVYFNTNVANFNLAFFLRHGVFISNIDYYFVINGYNIDSSISFPNLPNIYIIYRENRGFDFGGHSIALSLINIDDYEYFFFMNSGVFGPVLPHYIDKTLWPNFFIQKINDKKKLIGTTITCLPACDPGGFGPKIEGFFFVTDLIGIKILLNEKIIFQIHSDKLSAIIYGEYQLSKSIFAHGYTIDCMLLRYRNIDWLNPIYHNLNNNQHPSRLNSFYGKSICPYEVIFFKWYWANLPTVLFDEIKIINDYF